MDTLKVKSLLTGCLLAGILNSCGNSSTTEMVSKEKYDSKINEYIELNKKQEAIIVDNLEKNKIINNVVNELRQLSGETNLLRNNIETGTAKINQAEEIKLRLATIKNKLSNLPTIPKNGDNNLLQTISNLQKIIEDKENEIQQLQQQIAEQEEVIKNQQVTINKQQEELLRKQQREWYTLGNELYEVAGELPKVKGRKDKKNVKNAKFYILNKAKECFEQAIQLGHPQATDKRDRIVEEMEKL